MTTIAMMKKAILCSFKYLIKIENAKIYNTMDGMSEFTIGAYPASQIPKSNRKDVAINWI
jgi:hypothetical protein